MTMITPSYLGETIEYSSLHACRSTLEDPTAKGRAGLMETEIEDQLKGCRYQAMARDVIEDACKLGTGIMEGPIVSDRGSNKWTKGDDGQHVLENRYSDRPAFKRIDPWAFFGDPGVRDVGEGEGTYIRHLMNKKGLRKLARQRSFNEDAIRELLRQDPKETLPSYIHQLRTIGADVDQIGNDRYIVWKYSGPIEAEEMRTIATFLGDSDTIEDLAEEVDPLEEFNAVVWFCQDQILRFSIHPLDSGEPTYSVFNLERDETSMYGLGIPAIMRDEQKSLNAAWRMMMDNAGLSSGPQILVDRKHVEPANGEWIIEPHKVWTKKDDAPKDSRPFEVFNIDMHQTEIANIVQMSKQHVDEVTSLPALAEGQQGSEVTKTAGGMALLMNSANVVFRRIVKNFDDDMTTPNIRRIYDWNMQFSEKDEIKGDYEIDARGSSVLLVREMQAQNLMMVAQVFGGHPIFGPMIREANLLRAIIKAHMIPADEIILSDPEIKKKMAELSEQAAQQGAGDPAMAQLKAEELEFKREELDSKIQIANMESNTRLKVAKMQYDSLMEKLTSELNKQDREIDKSDRHFAAEVGMTSKIGPTGGGNF